MASTTSHVAVSRGTARARAGKPARRLGMRRPNTQGPTARRAVRCAAGEEVPLGAQIETALLAAFPPRCVARQHRERVSRTRRPTSWFGDRERLASLVSFPGFLASAYPRRTNAPCGGVHRNVRFLG